ncbi:MAG: ABC transporter ATP-binding protein, partial [Promethearchaeota archaeon]
MNDKELVVKFSGISKKFGNVSAVKDFNLEILKGEILGFVGPNGAGKTTTIKMLAGLLKPTAGHIRLVNKSRKLIDINKAKRGVFDTFGFLIDIPEFYASITVKKVLSYFCKLKKVPSSSINKKIRDTLELVNLLDVEGKRIKTLSKGMKQRLGIAQAIVHDPEVIVLDEPQSGLDPRGRIDVRNIIRHLRDKGKTIFLSSHLLNEVSELCDRVAFINQGSLVAVNTLASLEQGRHLQEIKCTLLEPLKNWKIKDILKEIDERVREFCPELKIEGNTCRYDNSLNAL